MLRAAMRRLPTTTVYLLYCAADGFLFRLAAAVFSVFLIVDLRLNPFRLLILGTILEVSYLVFEVPTGVVADTVSRKRSVVIGLLGSAVGFVLLGLAGSFLAAAISQVVWGVFATFQSGADVAWLTDEVGEEQARAYYLRGQQVWTVGSLVGIALGVALAAVLGLRAPIVTAGVGMVALALFLLRAMREERFVPRARGEGERLHQGMLTTLKDGIAQVRAHHILWLILAVAALHGASTEGFDRLADLNVLQHVGLPFVGTLDQIDASSSTSWVLWFGLLDGVGMLLGIGAIAYVKRHARLQGQARVARVLAAIDVALVVGVVVFAVTGSFVVAVAMFWLVGGLRSVREPVYTAWVNQGLEARTRATINSMATQADSVGQAAGGPVLGAIATVASVPWAIAVSGLLRLPALALYARAVRRGTVGTVRPADDALDLDAD
jgi:DHA3 family tetracycline resistance protein-like MFS transporter